MSSVFYKAGEERKAFNCVCMQGWGIGIPHAYCLRAEMDAVPFHGLDFPNLNFCFFCWLFQG